MKHLIALSLLVFSAQASAFSAPSDNASCLDGYYDLGPTAASLGFQCDVDEEEATRSVASSSAIEKLC